jgi:hypothetical protein
MKHFFPQMRQWLKNIQEPRKNIKNIQYPCEVMIWVGILLFLLKLRARRQINFIMTEIPFIKNLSILTKTALEKIPHDTTLEYFASKLSCEELEKIITKMIKRLLRMKALLKFRLAGHYIIVVDGTGLLTFKERHCEHCLTMKNDGKIIYYHKVLDAKLVSSTGLALSVATEFIENPSAKVKKQDCELNAFYRLAEKLKKRFPQLRICLLLDSLYAAEPVFKLCNKNRWKYIVTFKEGSMPAVYKEYKRLVDWQKQKNIKTEKIIETTNKKQIIQWVNDIDLGETTANVLSCKETVVTKSKEKTSNFVKLTNFEINKFNCEIIQKGGRLRWKIENEGFNIQKNGGYNLQHTYSINESAMKNYYLLMQIAHILNQLFEQANHFEADVQKIFGSIKNFTQKLLIALLTSVPSLEEINHIDNTRFQIVLRGP